MDDEGERDALERLERDREEIGEYRAPEMGDVALQAQQAFIYVLAQLKPDFGCDLAGQLEAIRAAERTPIRIERAIRGWSEDNGLPFELVLEGVAGFARLVPAPRFKCLRGAVGWGGPIAAEWLAASAEDTYERYGSSPDGRVENLAFDSGPFEYSHRGANLNLRNLSNLRSEILREVEESLSLWVERIRARAIDNRQTQNAQPRQRDVKDSAIPGEINVHFQWLVRHRCMGETQQAIAFAFGVTKQSVADAIRDAARLTGVTLPSQGKPGRPKRPPPRT